jgi:hypothetical protein
VMVYPIGKDRNEACHEGKVMRPLFYKCRTEAAACTQFPGLRHIIPRTSKVMAMAKMPSLKASIRTVSFRSNVAGIFMAFSGVGSFVLAAISALTIRPRWSGAAAIDPGWRSSPFPVRSSMIPTSIMLVSLGDHKARILKKAISL